MNEMGKQFSFTRAAPSTSGAAKSNFLSVAMLFLSCFGLPQVMAGGFTNGSPMHVARIYASATLLPKGKVLGAGGIGSGNSYFESAELYDPVSNNWTMTTPMDHARESHMATLLANGTVLVVGGQSPSDPSWGSAEIYDPSSASWSETTNTMITLLSSFSTPVGSLLGDGTVLVVEESLAALYDPRGRTFGRTGVPNKPRSNPSATLLADGSVLLLGGDNPFTLTVLSTAELYYSLDASWAMTGSMNTPREFHTATLLPDGKVLVAGGVSDLFSPNAVSSAEEYDPSTSVWTATGPMNTPRNYNTATRLRSGKVLVLGGGQGPFDNDSAELFDPVTGTWAQEGAIDGQRLKHTATLLANGKVLIAGGSDLSGAVANTELYDPTASAWISTGSVNVGRLDCTAKKLS